MAATKKFPFFLTSGILILVGALIFTGVMIKKKNEVWVHPRRGEIREFIYGLGTVKVAKKFEVKLGVPASIKEIFVREGDLVEKGHPLISFFDQKTVLSIMRGVVTAVNSNPGELIAPNFPVIQIENMESRYIEISMEQEGIQRLKKGDKAKVVFEELRNVQYEGTVHAIYAHNNEFIVPIDVPKLKDTILPGMTADIAIDVGHNPDALLVPLIAITSGHVLREREGKKKKVKLEVGKIDAKFAEVLKGDLLESDRVLLPGENAQVVATALEALAAPIKR
jgi:multidrug efflux pump subunit AcrA (membrane-fusion protein)